MTGWTHGASMAQGRVPFFTLTPIGRPGGAQQVAFDRLETWFVFSLFLRFTCLQAVVICGSYLSLCEYSSWNGGAGLPLTAPQVECPLLWEGLHYTEGDWERAKRREG